MHIQSRDPNGQVWGWDSVDDIPADHVRLTDEEIEARINPPKTPEQIFLEFQASFQSILDAEAKTHGYDGILSLCTYATSSIQKFRDEGQAGVVWRDQFWAKGYEIVAEVEAGTRPMPESVEELLAEMPVMMWPEQV